MNTRTIYSKLMTCLATLPLSISWANASDINWSNFEVINSVPIKVFANKETGGMELSGEWLMTTVGGCGEFYQGSLSLSLSATGKFIDVDDVPLRQFCKNNLDTQQSSDGFCTLRSNHNLLAGWNIDERQSLWIEDEGLSDQERRYSMFKNTPPIRWFDIDLDGDLELLVPSMCNTRMSPLIHVFEMLDLSEVGDSKEPVNPTLSFLSNAIFDLEKRTVRQFESNSACDYTEKIWEYDTQSKRFVEAQENTVKCPD